MSVTAVTLASILLVGQNKTDLRRDTTRLSGQPYTRYFTTDKFKREVTFYVTEAEGKAPLVVFVQGSGNGSNFIKVGERLVPQNGQTTLYDVAERKVRLLIVEKPGVKFLDPGDRGGAQSASDEFKQEHTFDRWAEAVGAALNAAKKIDGVDPGKILVVGHSEGGLVACRVAARDPEVKAVATLAGGGVTQLYDLVALARKGYFGGPDSKPEETAQAILKMWDDVLADPDSATKLFLGHPYRRWSSFLATSPVEELARFKGRVFIGQGSEDKAVDVSSADVLYAQLKSRGHNVTYDRVAGADHGFAQPAEKPGTGWATELKRVWDWFVKP
ncbi:MAG: alpha/beta fold hydrolase [Armatimonadetes bacterium]|nr:alpha/beta fold hydrolase [Armatimonadota bacterium]